MGIPQDLEALAVDLTSAEDAISAVAERCADLELIVAQLGDRAYALEAYVERNNARITLIEAFMADHQAGAERRQREVNQALQAAQRARWQQRTGRQA